MASSHYAGLSNVWESKQREDNPEASRGFAAYPHGGMEDAQHAGQVRTDLSN